MRAATHATPACKQRLAERLPDRPADSNAGRFARRDRSDAAALRADVVTLDALAHLARAARRADRQLVIHHASTELTTLLTLTGFTETLLSIGD
jgi:hypothetical protein